MAIYDSSLSLDGDLGQATRKRNGDPERAQRMQQQMQQPVTGPRGVVGGIAADLPKSSVLPSTASPQAGSKPNSQPGLLDGLAGGAKAVVGGAALPFAVGIDAARSGLTSAVGGDPNTLPGGRSRYADAASATLDQGLTQAQGASESLQAGTRNVLGVQPAKQLSIADDLPAAPVSAARQPLAAAVAQQAPAVAQNQAAPEYMRTGIGADLPGGEIVMRAGADGVTEFTNDTAAQSNARPFAASAARLQAGQSGNPTGMAAPAGSRVLASGSSYMTPDQELARLGSSVNLGNGIGTFSQAEAGSAQLALDRFERANQERGRMIAESRRGQIGEGGGRVTVVRDSSRKPTRQERMLARLDGRLAETEALRTKAQEGILAGLDTRQNSAVQREQALQGIASGAMELQNAQRINDLQSQIGDPNLPDAQRAAASQAYEALVPQGKGRYLEVRGGADADGTKAPSMVFDTRTGRFVQSPGAGGLPQGVDPEKAISDARQAVKDGVPREAVNQRLAQWGLDPV